MIYKKLKEFKAKEVKIVRDTTAYNYKYATLEQIQEKILPILSELNIIVTHRISDNKVITTIMDLDDETVIESEIELGTVKAQDKGSEITYYRRYNLLALLDLQTEDDDGKRAQESTAKTEIEWVNDKQFEAIKKKTQEGKYKSWDEIKKGLDENGMGIKKAWREELTKIISDLTK